MNTPNRPSLCVALSGALLLCTPAAAEVVLEMRITHDGDVELNELLVSSGRLAIRGADGSIDSIYDQASNTLYSLDHEGRAYTSLDRDSVHQIADEIDSAMAEMRRQLDAMPPEQREVVERMMRQTMGDGGGERADPGQRRVNATGRSGEAAGVGCEWYDVLENDDQVGTACVAPRRDVPGGDELVAMLTAMGEFYDDLLTQLAGRIPMSLPPNPVMPLAELGGLPILSTEQRPGEEATQTELLQVRRESVDDAVFEVPPGYRRVAIGE